MNHNLESLLIKNANCTRKDCTCNNVTSNKICVICDKTITLQVSELDARNMCGIHGKVRICGEYEYVCNECSEMGWYSTSGYGGKTQHINKISGEVRDI